MTGRQIGFKNLGLCENDLIHGGNFCVWDETIDLQTNIGYCV
jgi:hypothetical protein